MKIFFFTTLIALASCLVYFRPAPTQSIQADRKYANPQFNYQIDWPETYTIDEARGELVVMNSTSGRLRINAGCFDWGTEGMVSTSEQVTIENLQGLKERFYLNSKLYMIRYAFTQNDRCYYLELFSSTELGWQELLGLAKSFRIN